VDIFLTIFICDFPFENLGIKLYLPYHTSHITLPYLLYIVHILIFNFKIFTAQVPDRTNSITIPEGVTLRTLVRTYIELQQQDKKAIGEEKERMREKRRICFALK
jgi:hypothetical protein